MGGAAMHAVVEWSGSEVATQIRATRVETTTTYTAIAFAPGSRLYKINTEID
jgi:hypothetical protein